MATPAPDAKSYCRKKMVCSCTGKEVRRCGAVGTRGERTFAEERMMEAGPSRENGTESPHESSEPRTDAKPLMDGT